MLSDYNIYIYTSFIETHLEQLSDKVPRVVRQIGGDDQLPSHDLVKGFLAILSSVWRL